MCGDFEYSTQVTAKLWDKKNKILLQMKGLAPTQVRIIYFENKFICALEYSFNKRDIVTQQFET